MPNAKDVLVRCRTAMIDMQKRLEKYRQGLDALAGDNAITEAKIKKRSVKLDSAFKEATNAEKEAKDFLKNQFLKDYADADDDKKKIMDNWKKQVEKMLKEMNKLQHISNLLPPVEAFFE